MLDWIGGSTIDTFVWRYWLRRQLEDYSVGWNTRPRNEQEQLITKLGEVVESDVANGTYAGGPPC